MHLYHLAKLDRDSSLTQAQLGKLSGKTKAASSAMERGMDREIRERTQARTGFLVKPPKRVDMIREMGRAMRIHKSGRNARLASPDETEYVHELLEKRGFGA